MNRRIAGVVSFAALVMVAGCQSSEQQELESQIDSVKMSLEEAQDRMAECQELSDPAERQACLQRTQQEIVDLRSQLQRLEDAAAKGTAEPDQVPPPQNPGTMR